MEVLWSKTGSKGNASVISDGQTLIQIDAGITPEVVNREINYRLNDVFGVLVSHLHGDRPQCVYFAFFAFWNESICQRRNMD